MQSKAKAPPTTGKASFRDQIARAFAGYPPTQERIQKAQTAISTLLPNRNNYVLDTSDFQEVKAKVALAERPSLRRHRAGDGPTKGPVLHRHPSPDVQPYRLAGSSPIVTNGRFPSVFSYLPAFPY